MLESCSLPIPLHTGSPLDLLSQLRADQRQRWQRGQRIPAETYREREAALRIDPELFLDLVYSEYLLREELGESPTLDEYVWRFPDFANELRLQFEVQQALARRPTPKEDSCPTPVEELDGMGQLGPYRILRQLGVGGMGRVFEAEDVDLRRRVALKVPSPETAANPIARARFLREARAAASLRNDHIVTVFQVGEDRGVPYLAMELLTGVSLEDRLRDTVPLASMEILRLGRQIALGLAAVHARGLIHRDIKPANLWLESGEGGRLKILDFSLARAEGDDAHLTANGVLVGTPAYMATGTGSRRGGRCTLRPVQSRRRPLSPLHRSFAVHRHDDSRRPRLARRGRARAAAA